MYYILETEKFVSPYEKYLSYGYPMYEVQGSKGIPYNMLIKRAIEITFPIAPADFTTNETKVP